MAMVSLSQILNNPFKKLTVDEKQELKVIEQSVRNDIRRFSALAKELFTDNRYMELEKEFKKIYEQNLKLIIYFDCDDPNKYIMKMRELQVQIRTLKNIFDTPEGFVKSEENINKNDNRIR